MNLVRPWLVLLCAAFGWGLGCGSGTAGACNITNTSPAGYTYCVNYTGSGQTTQNVMAACMAGGSTYANGCTGRNDGICVFNGGTANEYKEYFDTSASDGGINVMQVCMSAG